MVIPSMRNTIHSHAWNETRRPVDKLEMHEGGGRMFKSIKLRRLMHASLSHLPASPLSAETLSPLPPYLNTNKTRKERHKNRESEKSLSFSAFFPVLYCSLKVKHQDSQLRRKVMEIYLSLLALVGLSFYVHCVQFEDEANLEQTK